MPCDDEERLSLKVNDFGHKIEITILCKKTEANPEGVQDLSGVEWVHLRLHKKGTDEPSIDREMDVIDAEGGVVEYTWVPEDTAEELTWEIEVIVHFSGDTQEITWPEDEDRPEIPVYDRLPAPAAP